MRIRSKEQPPSRRDINRIVGNGASKDDKTRFDSLLRRLRQAFFLDKDCRPLSARERLMEQYRKDGLVLFLGAGVSAGSRIPNWRDLADALLRISGVSPYELSNVKKALPSYITQFELAGQLLGSKKELTKEIYKTLYKSLNCKSHLKDIPRQYKEQCRWSGWPRILEALQANKSLSAIGDLLITDAGANARRNPQIHAVLTVNVDNLLELYCKAKAGGRRVVTMVDRASVGDHPDQIPVYHLHGTLDARDENVFRAPPSSVTPDELQEISDELLPDLVFRESEYFDTIANPTSFVNHTPQSFFRRLNTLFIGTSLDDLNMRRWLHDSFHERVQHRTKFLREFYWKQYDDAKYEATLESLRHFWLRLETQDDGDGKSWNVPKRYVDCVMNNLGVQIVWCKSCEDMRNSINELRQSGQDKEFGRHPAPYPS